MADMIVRTHQMDDHNEVLETLRYGLGRPPEERLTAVDELRRQCYGPPQRMQRVVRIVRQEEARTWLRRLPFSA
jgi:hypothetical protein